ncbi:hypothetical protein [Tsuneonella sp. HG222]
MRKILPIAVLAAVMFAPAAAADPAEEDLARASEEMRDPARQEQMGRMAEAVMGAMLDMPVGKLLQAAATVAGEDEAGIDPDTTLAEVAGPDAEDAPREFARAMPRMMDAMGALTDALGTMMPELRRAGAEIARSLPDDLPE